MVLSTAPPAKRIVVKLGTQVVIQEQGGLALEKLSVLAHQCAALMQQGKEVILVSSGAVGLGRKALKLGDKLSLAEKQACAAVGQTLLMDAYGYLFNNYGLKTAQLLLTALDFTDRQRYLNLQKTLDTLLALNVVPIINENDTVSTTELAEKAHTKSFGDNDKLSALVASRLDANLLVILTNVDGVYTDNPATNPQAKRLSLIENLEQLDTISINGQSSYGRGGMATKIEAAKIAAFSGIHTLILSGGKVHRLATLFDPANDVQAWEDVGTLILPQRLLSGRKRWIGFASGYCGIVVINEGAKNALIQRNASLLPIGILSVEGHFQAGQVVSLRDEAGHEVGRGLINFSSEETDKIKGCQSQEIAAILGSVEDDVVIQRDYLVVFQEIES
jgi:glutamate 5-kinase